MLFLVLALLVAVLSSIAPMRCADIETESSKDGKASINITSQPDQCFLDCTFSILDISQDMANKVAACSFVGGDDDDKSPEAVNASNAATHCFCSSDDIMGALEGCMKSICPGNMTNQIRDFCKDPNFTVDTGSGTSDGAGTGSGANDSAGTGSGANVGPSTGSGANVNAGTVAVLIAASFAVAVLQLAGSLV
ncbi:hypothetical protein EXIGLDRAFT_763685 [Exidia glandulosa HHB12029]|uniref:Extracellular membrane protein CFEM domain-containing protein n=1 Tax=Exidia glandulosa HHB12029 TaxID=1314781 RepID=A0A165LQS5_EXIGL|nr:hypothetical protein EXIGLDRAFT_763685 [Exidia glandulosa HHB12029]